MKKKIVFMLVILALVVATAIAVTTRITDNSFETITGGKTTVVDFDGLAGAEASYIRYEDGDWHLMAFFAPRFPGFYPGCYISNDYSSCSIDFPKG